MSHFVALVMLPGAEAPPFGDDDPRLAALLARYDEDKEVPEYEEDCYCTRADVRQRAEAWAVEQFGKTLEEHRDAFWAQYPGQADRIAAMKQGLPLANGQEVPYDKELVDRFDQLLTEWWAPVETLIREGVERQRPFQARPDCTDCHGTGKVLTTYNPDSKWDWWVVGGRWRGYFPGERDWIKSDELLACNRSAPPADRKTGRAVITPDGEWHQRGEMGWFGTSTGDKLHADWDAEVAQQLAQFPDHWVVACDLHI